MAGITWHATEDHDDVERTLCGQGLVTTHGLLTQVDNANPNCKRCLRSIEKRTRGRR